jgi:hypothetical protein
MVLKLFKRNINKKASESVLVGFIGCRQKLDDRKSSPPRLSCTLSKVYQILTIFFLTAQKSEIAAE